MKTNTVDTSEEAGNATVRERIVDACRQSAHLSHEARLLKSLAADAVGRWRPRRKAGDHVGQTRRRETRGLQG